MKTVALDDIRILDTCRSESERFCDFESGDMCGYTTYGDFKWKLEKGVAMLHIYDDEVIVGSIKYAGHMNRKSKSEVRNFIRLMYSDILECFADRKIIIPSGSYFEYLHLTMNQKKIQHEPYHRELMQQFGFERQDKYWIRYANQVYRYH